ncbi:MAG: cytochrome b/b6 domain-containing protein [Desulfobulbaceae bacterium]|jgi:thiosulfate reductase cytochrome b subunit|nr:cytochrome b/b6 domain-containing protein [Desulfobulbaceae bacterium]HKJ15120.1 cytochrome b/b6 domain-containing protein [Desulfobulbales bacterium]MDH3776616.1 cytochrome b/b6 domain-containing protein [Desulfobulbaceae bacterium]MDH3782351.1 cytochrome b/b6 domain-containing protein [Desulfobulbaceae bacterium]MDH3865851.1 cytochrome b/b6 domain-containing protein [Desulfobulbaceae bacterium]
MGDDKLMYVHPAPVRVWHWVNAVGFIILIITGIQIRFAEMVNWFSLEEAIKLHNYVGFVVIAVYGLWVSYYFGTMKIKLYFPNPRTFVPNAIKQLKYYGAGIFRGEPNPHQMTPDNKFNALQKNAYVGIMFVFLPAQMITGLFLWRVKRFENYIDLIGGIKIVSSIHVLLFFFFVAFLFVHIYLATLGHTPWAHFKAMFTGYEEHHGPEVPEETVF